MTTLISWIGVDSRGPSSIYLASDSRISWGSNCSWDYGQKIFLSQKYPEILGYCGDAFFPPHLLNQLISLIDNDLFFAKTDSAVEKNSKVFAYIKNSIDHYPKKQKRNFTIVYCHREKEQMNSIFHSVEITWKHDKGLKQSELEIPTTSSIIGYYGSGRKSFHTWLSRWEKTKQRRTSRSIFSAFCDSLFNEGDKLSGGAPQIVGIYRTNPGKLFGVIYKKSLFIYGRPLEDFGNFSSIEWRDCLFERCDPQTLNKIENAKKHIAPKGLGKACKK